MGISSRHVPEQKLCEDSTNLATRSSYTVTSCTVSRREKFGGDNEGHSVWSSTRLARVNMSGKGNVLTEIECELRGEIHGI
jgi:hypothetical protein